MWCSDKSTLWKVQDLGNVQHISAGVVLSCGWNETELWCWTDGEEWLRAQPPPNLRANDPWYKERRRGVPIQLPEGLRIRDVQVGSVHACILSADATVYCFGRGEDGSWGNGLRRGCKRNESEQDCSQLRVAQRVQLSGSPVKQLAVSGIVSCVLKQDGTVWCWGNNQYGVVSSDQKPFKEGRAVMFAEPFPLQRSELGKDNRRLMAGGGHACVEKNNGDLWCWGSNRVGQFEDHRAREWIEPRRIPLPAPRCTSGK